MRMACSLIFFRGGNFGIDADDVEGVDPGALGPGDTVLAGSPHGQVQFRFAHVERHVAAVLDSFQDLQGLLGQHSPGHLHPFKRPILLAVTF